MSTNTVDQPKKVTTSTVARMKQQGEKIAMITAYDYTMASLVDASGIDLILVGDSAANIMAAQSNHFSPQVPLQIYSLLSFCLDTLTKQRIIHFLTFQPKLAAFFSVSQCFLNFSALF